MLDNDHLKGYYLFTILNVSSICRKTGPAIWH